MSKKTYLAASACAATLMMASAAFATPTVTLYGTFSDNVTGVSPSGDNAPTVSATGGNGIGSSFTVSNLGGGSVQNAGTFFTVDPAGSIKNNCRDSCGGTDSADINITLDFYSSAADTNLLGTLTDTALTTFNYSAQDDILCWQDSSVGGTAVTAHSAAGGTCSNIPGSGTTGFEKITVSLNGSTYIIDLGDWSDWNETPSISFQMTCYTNCGAGPSGQVPEPLTLSLFGAGLAGAAAIRRRKKKAA
jgi:hypothetical protein